MASPRPAPAPSAPVSSDAPKAEEPLALDALEPGASGEITEVDGGSEIAERLLDLGFVPGTTVEVVRRAPLGDPTEYALRGTRICLRRTEGAHIRVRRV